MELEKHYTNRSRWLRAAALGANDGILSTTSIAIGFAAASITRSPVILAALAGLVAGALSMAAGEYLSAYLSPYLKPRLNVTLITCSGLCLKMPEITLDL